MCSRFVVSLGLLFAAHTLAQTNAATLDIPAVKTAVNIEGQPIEFSVGGNVSPSSAGIFRLAATVDLGNLQQNLTPVLSAQLNKSERCGSQLTVEKATIAPAAPFAVLTANVHYERFGCAKAFGKEIVKRLIGGTAVIEVNLTPSIGVNGIALAGEVRKVDADGSLGDWLRSGQVGDSIRDKIASSVESAIRKSANLNSALPAGIEQMLTIGNVQFADGGAGRLWLNVGGEIRLSPEQFQSVAKKLHP